MLNDSIEIKIYKPHWDAQPKMIKSVCGHVSDAINSQLITYEHVRLFILNHYIFSGDKFAWHALKVSDIKKMADLYSKTRYEIDKKFILDLIERTKPKTVFEKLSPEKDKLFKINDDGKNYLYSLVINNYISPLMFAKMYNSNVFILDESKLDTDMFRFIKAAKQIIKTTKKKEGV